MLVPPSDEIALIEPAQLLQAGNNYRNQRRHHASQQHEFLIGFGALNGY